MINQEAIKFTILSSPVIFCFTISTTRTAIALNDLETLFDSNNLFFFIPKYIQYRLKYKMKYLILVTQVAVTYK